MYDELGNVEETQDEVGEDVEARTEADGAVQAVDGQGAQPGVWRELGELPPGAIVTEEALARMFGVTRRTVRRMVGRFELPPPIRLSGRSVWLVGRILSHIEAAAERAEREAQHGGGDDAEGERAQPLPLAEPDGVDRAAHEEGDEHPEGHGYGRERERREHAAQVGAQEAEEPPEGRHPLTLYFVKCDR